MGIFSMFIVIPMMIQILFVWFLYDRLLSGDPRHVLMLGGVMMIAAAAATMLFRQTQQRLAAAPL